MAKKKIKDTKKKTDYSKENGMDYYCQPVWCTGCGERIPVIPMGAEQTESFLIECPHCSRVYRVEARIYIVSEHDRNKFLI